MKRFCVPAARQRQRQHFSTQQSRLPAQEASRLSQWAVEPWTVEQSICLIPPPITWMSACLSVDKKATPVKSPKVYVSEYVVIFTMRPVELRQSIFLLLLFLQRSL